ncbi:hypothetical protein PoB_005848300 [Plakobranchus ocellatus]|uniref:Uncharacterized protein n=1 Tax=Plakobranchus ocellatus TaxID=259542 RepID=A0AAV4CLD1_9GAST|nr:hypothetical protein PoB_005848300 [Plakobranchus ocellatus]
MSDSIPDSDEQQSEKDEKMILASDQPEPDYPTQRDVCSHHLVENTAQIGGIGHHVEIDESLMSKRKNNVHRVVQQSFYHQKINEMASTRIDENEVFGLLDLSDSEVSDWIPDSDKELSEKDGDLAADQPEPDYPTQRCVET